MIIKFISKIKSPLRCSLFTRKSVNLDSVVIYAHSLIGNKLEGKFTLNYFLPEQAVLLFDFIGCGNSEGNHVTYGVKEAFDLEKIVKVLIKKFLFKKIYLWGRGMGAVAVINFMFNLEKKRLDSKLEIGESLDKLDKSNLDEEKKSVIKKQIINSCLSLKTIEDNNEKSDIFLHNENVEDLVVYDRIKGLVFDSPYPDLKNFILEYLRINYNKNKTWTNMFFFNIIKDIKKKVGIDIFHNNSPIEKIMFLKKPCILMISEKDEFIDCEKSIEMFNLYGANLKKMRLMINCEHFGERPSEDIYYAAAFLKKLHKGFYKENICVEDSIEEAILNEKQKIESERNKESMIDSDNFVSYTKKTEKEVTYNQMSELTGNTLFISDVHTIDFVKGNFAQSEIKINKQTSFKKISKKSSCGNSSLVKQKQKTVENILNSNFDDRNYSCNQTFTEKNQNEESIANYTEKFNSKIESNIFEGILNDVNKDSVYKQNCVESKISKVNKNGNKSGERTEIESKKEEMETVEIREDEIFNEEELEKLRKEQRLEKEKMIEEQKQLEKDKIIEEQKRIEEEVKILQEKQRFDEKKKFEEERLKEQKKIEEEVERLEKEQRKDRKRTEELEENKELEEEQKKLLKEQIRIEKEERIEQKKLKKDETLRLEEEERKNIEDKKKK